MTVTYNTPKRIGPDAWRGSWTSTKAKPLFRIFQDGREIGETYRASQNFSVSPGESLIIDVFDDAVSVPPATSRARVSLLWPAAAGADRYRLQEFVGAAWVTRAIVRDDSGALFVVWPTAPLDDAHGYQFRAVPIGTDGNEGTPVAVTFDVVRSPDPPQVLYAYAAGFVTITLEV